MAGYHYHIVTPSGKEKRGVIEASDRIHAVKALKAEGNTVISIRGKELPDIRFKLPLAYRTEPRDMSLFCRQFGAVISVGVSVARALDILVEQTNNKTLKEALRETRSCVENGEKLSEGMRHQTDVFPEMFINLVKAGEETGKLELSFERMALQYEKKEKIRSIVEKAMIYPVILWITSVAVVIVMMMYIVPMYTSLFQGMDTELPIYTRVVMKISEGLLRDWPGLLLAGTAAALLLRAGLRTEKGKYIAARMALSIPVFGEINRKHACAQFARNLSTLLIAGVPVMEGLKTTADTMDNRIYCDAVRNAREQVSQGVPLAVFLKDCGMFPPIVCHMAGVGEETGKLDIMLENLALYYEEEVETAAGKAAAAMEPMIILIMSAIVILIILAVYTPMVAMYQNAGSLM